jgi:murein DD-endopeptidase MepM/ murein hydrolase activator NlpD
VVRSRSRVALWLWLFGLPAVLVVAALGVLAWRQSVPGVQAEITPAPRFLGIKTPLTVKLRATRGGVDRVELRLVQGQGRVVLAQQRFPDRPAEPQLPITVEAGRLGLREGAATLEVFARDGFWRPLRVDDRPVLARPVTLDVTPPGVEVLAATRYLSQGGAGIVVFRSRGAVRVGLNVGGIFLPAYPAGGADGSVMVALVALPWDFPDNAPLLVSATDEAGNTTSRPVPAEIRPRRFPSDVIDLGPEFVAAKVAELLPGRAVGPADLLPAFLEINRGQREQAEQAKRRLAARTQPRPLWEGAFLQPRNTKVFSNFAETRRYRLEGRDVDTQVHLGYDLASVRQSPVPAANAGVVVHAGPLTIYGNTVIVDHGLGLMTLYAHLSSIAVAEGEQVDRGRELGRTGTTGLAVGDHLHYEVLVHGISVTPLEWWDARWIRDRIGRPLREAGVPLLQAEQPAAEEERRRPPRRRRG